MTDVSEATREVILAFADDEHLMGQQHTEWIGVAPFLEEDLAFASIGQDELGHAASLLEVLVGTDDADIDALAFYREPADWRSAALTEISLTDWSDTLVRHWLYDAAETLRWDLFVESSNSQLRGVAERAQSEERFHRQHADSLLDVLLRVPDAAARVGASLDKVLPVALAFFDGVAGEADAIAEGVISNDLASLRAPWQTAVDERFGPQDWSGIDVPAAAQRTTRHGDFGPLLARMLEVLDLDRTVRW